MTDDLKALSDAATGGEWKPYDGYVNDHEGNYFGQFELPADAKLSCTAINALRAGKLVEAVPLRELVATIREKAENAANRNCVCDGDLEEVADALAALIGEDG